MGSLWIIDIHWWLLWGAATRERNCHGTADRGPCDIGDNGCWRWHCFPALICPYIYCFKMFQDVSSFHSTFLQTRQCNDSTDWTREVCRLLQWSMHLLNPSDISDSLTRCLCFSYTGVSWAMGATAECFRLSWGRSGTWQRVMRVMCSILFYCFSLFLVISCSFDIFWLTDFTGILWDTKIWAKARGSIQQVRDSSFRISDSRRVAGWRLGHIHELRDLMIWMHFDFNSFELACPLIHDSALERLTKVVSVACIVVSEIDPTIVFWSSKPVGLSNSNQKGPCAFRIAP